MAQPPTTATETFSQKEYAHYVVLIPAELATPTVEKVLFVTIVQVGIALEKTAGWDEAAGKQAFELLAKAPDLRRYLDGVRLLLTDDPAGLARLYDGQPPADFRMNAAVPVLREHGFPLAATMLRVVALGASKSQIADLLSIPEPKRAAVQKILMTTLKTPDSRAMLADIAMAMYLKPPNDLAVDPEALLPLAYSLGAGTRFISLNTAYQLAQGGKKADAVQLARRLAAEQPRDVNLQVTIAGFIRQAGDQEAAIAQFRHALTTVPEPSCRTIRIGYLRFLQLDKQPDEVTKALHGADAMLAADAAYLLGQFTDAATRYAAIMADQHATLGMRVAAWSGLLETDPEQALTTGAAICGEVAKSEGETRGALITWSARQLWNAVARVVPALQGQYRSGWGQPYKDLHTVTDWENRSAALMACFIDADQDACLRPDSTQKPSSLRYPVALTFALAGKPEHVIDIMAKKLTFQLLPPAGGWDNGSGFPTRNGGQPRTITTPTVQEMQQMTKQLFTDLASTPRAAQLVPPLALAVAQGHAAAITATTRDAEISAGLTALANIVLSTVVAIDPKPRVLRTDQPPPPVRPVDMAQYQPLDTLIRELLKNDAIAKHGLVLINAGLRDALMTASNPDLLNALTDLARDVTIRYGQLSNNPVDAANARKTLANTLAARPVYDMNLYIEKLLAPE